MQLTVTIWNSPAELPANFVEATTKFTGLSFSTQAQGGFTDASFAVKASGWNAVKWYREYLGFHVVIFDHLGRRVYEGSIEDAEADSEGVTITCLGYHAAVDELLHGVIYPIGTPATPTNLIEDVVDIASAYSVWSPDKSMVSKLTHDISPQDFSGEKKLADAIAEATKFGDNGLNPRPVYLAVWDHRRAYLYVEPSLVGKPTWLVYMKDFASAQGLGLSRSRSTVWNRIQVVYDDPLIGTTFTDFAEDKDSQRKFRIREGTVNIGQSLEGVAEVVRDLAIKAYASPEQTSSIEISNRVYSYAGAPDYPYMIRAGSLIKIMDYDPSVAQQVAGTSGQDTSVALISRTTYNAESNTISIELGRKSMSLDLFMAKLGTGSGSIS
jgi:hypothetical protein